MRRFSNKYGFLIVAVFLVLGVSLISRAAVPLYDGIGFPDEPYRYVDPPKPSLKTPKAPGVAIGTFDTNNLTDGLDINSGEYFPQVSIYLDSSVALYPANATTITLEATPQAPSNEPAGWNIVGNVYHFTGTTDAGTLTLKAHSIDAHHYRTIDMRLAQGNPPYPTFFYEPPNSTKWQQLQTYRVGNDIYEAVIVNFGNYALAHQKAGSTAPATSKKNASYTWEIIIAILPVGVGIVIFVIRNNENKKSKKKIKKKKKK